ncbi:hypothetical protein TRFO_40156 [Tritrichomonas foetus]|uniref:Uncharacterized protein n=1 Tax=Tritrichomonas foetus TaxID=1144522 RepID=A0A1J4J7E0_9EUKA|nr:hypothetical protein TRFO_40156 [Tritrichomonas foetus]|eukprot:OHS93571.1 hypothetical protein TRFO_40156 [Tritrichomonas foetus]
MEDNSDPYNFYTSIYRHDVSRWGGRTHRKPENISREMDVSQIAATSSSVKRCMNSMTKTCRPVCTPTSLYRDSYVPHMPVTRGLFPIYSNRTPEAPAPPGAPDPSLLRPTTEYGSRYRPPNPKPFISQELTERCSTATVTTRSFNRQTHEVSPIWNTTYRASYCEKPYDPTYSSAITFHSATNLR